MRKFLVSFSVLLLAGTSVNAQDQNASALGKGRFLFSVQATELTATAADTLVFGDGDYPSLVSGGVVGGKATIAYGMSDRWALNGSFLWATGYEKVDPPDSVGTEQKLSINAFGVRVGVDRHVQLADWFSFYGGPGLQWTIASSEWTVDTGGTSSTTYENPSANSFALSGRLGAFVRLSEKFGLYWDLGQRFVVTSKKVRGKASQLSSSHDGNLGVAVVF